MGNMCSSKEQGVSPVTPNKTPGENLADMAREFAKQMRLNRQKLEVQQEYLRDFIQQLNEADSQDDKSKLLISDSNNLEASCTSLMDELDTQSQQIGNLIDQCENPLVKNVNRDTINSEEVVVASLSNKILDIERQIGKLKKQRKTHLVENDSSHQLFEDLSLMISRIQDESNNYQILLKEISDQIQDLMALLSCILEDEVIKKDYEEKQESLLKQQEIVSANQTQYESITERFSTAIAKLSELQTLFKEQSADKENLSCQQLDYINEEAKKFLEINKNLGADIMHLQKSLLERREKLFDLDIVQNLTLRRDQYDALFNLAMDIEEAISVIMRGIELQLISAIDDSAQKILVPIKQEIDAMSRKLRDKSMILKSLNKQLAEKEKLIGNNQSQENLKIMSIKVLIPHIKKISEIGQAISSVKVDLEEISQSLEMKKIMMGDTNLEQKVNDHSQRSLEHRESINAIKSEIETMRGLFSDLLEYASDEEEGQNIEIIKQQVDQLHEQVSAVENSCQKTSIEIEDMINELQEVQDENGQTRDLIERISEIEKLVNSNDKQVEEISEKLQKREQRFNEFDLKSKYGKRIKQSEEGKIYRNKVKNRSNKMIRKINEKQDLNLKEEDQAKLSELKEKALQYKNSFEEYHAVHEKLSTYLEKNLQSKIPDDPLSISVQDQIGLLKEMKQLKLKLIENNKNLLELRENLMLMQDQVHNIKEEQDPELDDQYLIEDYIPQENDQMDNLMSDYLNNGSKKIQIEIKRVGEGTYMFGSKKVLTKIVNGKLTVRVGGGVMSVEEFIATYAEKEMQKQMEREYEDLNSVNSFTAAGQSIIRKKTVAAKKQAQEEGDVGRSLTIAGPKNGNGNKKML